MSALFPPDFFKKKKFSFLEKKAVSPCVVLSVHLYLPGRFDSRAENSHEECEHVYLHVYEFLEAFRARRGRYVRTSDHKTLYSFSCFFVCIFHLSLFCSKNQYDCARAKL